jgi:hypothetical protein
MYSPEITLVPWVRIQLEAWMDVYIASMSVVSYADRGFVTGWVPIQRDLPTVCKIHNIHITV